MKSKKNISRIILGVAALVLLTVFFIRLLGGHSVTAWIWAGGAALLGITVAALNPEEEKEQRAVRSSLFVLILSLMAFAFVAGKSAAPSVERSSEAMIKPAFTETAAPSFTAAPTATPEPTLAPTSTPEPTPEPTPEVTEQSYTEEPTPEPTVTKAASETEHAGPTGKTVPEEEGVYYITRTGECFHRRGCRYTPYKWYANREDAIAAGYRPCSQCNP